MCVCVCVCVCIFYVSLYNIKYSYESEKKNQTDLFNPYYRPSKVPPVRVIVDLRVIPIKGFFTQLKSLKLELNDLEQLSVITRTLLLSGGESRLPVEDTVNVFGRQSGFLYSDHFNKKNGFNHMYCFGHLLT